MSAGRSVLPHRRWAELEDPARVAEAEAGVQPS
jgi:hypothetical protein